MIPHQRRRWAFAVALMAIFACAATGLQAQHRDRGVNQPGAAGNISRDPGINQPGAAGNRGVAYGGSARQVRAVHDPGFNQPGAVGNVGRDPGLNQPGAVGNRRR
jgi:hypothetical protein